MRRSIPLLILLIFALTSCASPQVPLVTPGVTPSSTPMPSPTPTAAVGESVSPTSQPQGKGYTLEFTNQVSSGFATLHASAHTCSGWRGPWEGSFEVELDFERMHLSGSGPFKFTVPEGEFFVQGEAPFSGGGTVSDTKCIILDVSDPLRFEISFSSDGRMAEVIMGSRGAGTITTQCPDRQFTIPFAIAWGPNPLTVEVQPYGDCP